MGSLRWNRLTWQRTNRNTSFKVDALDDEPLFESVPDQTLAKKQKLQSTHKQSLSNCVTEQSKNNNKHTFENCQKKNF
jgi:hypothetical protein